MAECYQRLKQIEYEMVLTEGEAKMLRQIMGGHILGDSKGPRGICDRIYQALCDAGVGRAAHPTTDRDRYIYFLTPGEDY